MVAAAAEVNADAAEVVVVAAEAVAAAAEVVAAGTDAVGVVEIDAAASDYGFGAVETAVQLTLWVQTGSWGKTAGWFRIVEDRS